MQIIKHNDRLSEVLNMARASGKKVHLIPTMGALHQGHLSLVENALEQGAIIVVSVFVNPLQFNEPDDLANYPRTFEADKKKLSSSGCDVMFFPSENEIYPENTTPNYILDGLESIMEGQYRPGHFQGVVQVVARLFSIVNPDRAFFGQKDFQQLAIIRHMMTKLGHRTEVIGCPTVREKSGLAMSSRNTLLSEKARIQSNVIYTALKHVQEGYINGLPIEQIIKSGSGLIDVADGFKLEYLEVVDPDRLTRIYKNENKAAVSCVAAYVEGIRLIDNLMLIA